MSKHVYLALDSDVLRNLADLSDLIEENPDWDADKLCDHVQKIDPHSPMISNMRTYLDLLDIAENPESDMRLLVTTTPFNETKNIPNVAKFIKQYCYVPNAKILMNKDCQEDIHELAKAYCSEIKKEDKVFPPPMKGQYNSYVGRNIPSNDAYVMAEATYFGAFLITENVKDLIAKKNKHLSFKESSYRPHSGNVITRGIVDINIERGYGQPAPNMRFGEDNLNVPRGVAVKDFYKLFNMRNRQLRRENVEMFTTTDDKLIEKYEELGK